MSRTAIDFHLAVDWRWQRVKELHAAGRAPSRTKDDKWTRRAWHYQRKKATMHVNAESRLAEVYPAIHLAFKIFDDTHSMVRWIIEAGVLADVEPQTLADYLALPVEVIDAYEKLYFDVRSKLHAEGYITGCVIGPLIASGIAADDPDGFWKILAFYGGWDHVRGCWRAGKATEEALSYYRDIARHQAILKAAASGLVVQPNSYNAPDLMRIGMEQIHHEEETGSGLAADKRLAALQAVINNINLMVRDPREQLEAEEPRACLPSAAEIYRTEAKVEGDE